jgi:hypothetical protein
MSDERRIPTTSGLTPAWLAPAVLVACLILVACGGGDSGNGSSGAGRGVSSGGTSGTGAGGSGGNASEFVSNPGVCDAGKCNGRCLAEGEAEGSCTFIGNIGMITIAAGPDGALYSAWFANVYALTLNPPAQRKIEPATSSNSFSELAVSATDVFAGAASTGNGVVAYRRSDDTKTVLDADASDTAEMQLAGDTVYYQVDDFLGGPIRSVTATSTTPATLVPGNNDLLALNVDSTHLYWSQETGNSSSLFGIIATLQRAPLSDPTNVEVLATETTAEHLVGNETTLFWTSDTTLFTLSKSGGAPVEVALGGAEVFCATNAGAVVFQQAPTATQLGRLLLVDATGKATKLADFSSVDDAIVSGGKVYVQQANIGLYEVALP